MFHYFPIPCTDGSGDLSLSSLMGPIIGGSIASGVLLLVIIYLLITLLCILKQRNRRKLVINSFRKLLVLRV